jgi:folate-binding protein YgfZ
MFSEEGYRALTEGAAVVRRGDRGVLSVTGPDRLTWLQGLVTNDVSGLPVGGVCDAAYLTPQGRMITDLRVANFADRTLLDVPATLSSALHARLDALLFSEDAKIEDLSQQLTVVDVHGPLAPGISADLEVVRDDAFGVPGYSAFVVSTEVSGFIRQLVARGAVETTLETLDVLRVEAGRPAFLVDMDEHTIPLEAGLEQRAISFTKGCYVGQEVIVRVMHRGGGRVAKRLVGLRLGQVAVPGAKAVITSAGLQIGRVTSAVWSPALRESVALGYVHRDFTDPGTSVEINGTHGSIPAQVTALPLVERKRLTNV